MAGTTSGGKSAAQKNLARDPDFYRKIALKAQQSWERNGRKPRGFAAISRERHLELSTKGGYASKRPSKKTIRPSSPTTNEG